MKSPDQSVTFRLLDWVASTSEANFTLNPVWSDAAAAQPRRQSNHHWEPSSNETHMNGRLLMGNSHGGSNWGGGGALGGLDWAVRTSLLPLLKRRSFNTLLTQTLLPAASLPVSPSGNQREPGRPAGVSTPSVFSLLFLTWPIDLFFLIVVHCLIKLLIFLLKLNCRATLSSFQDTEYRLLLFIPLF